MMLLLISPELDSMQDGLLLKAFDSNQDSEQVELLLSQNSQLLFGNPEFDINRMVVCQSLTPQVLESHNSLIMLVLKENLKNILLSFIAYEIKDSRAWIRLLATKEEHRKRGYATFLINEVIKIFSDRGVTQATFETREINSVVAWYEKLLSSIKNVSYSKNPIRVPNKEIIDAICFEIALNKK